ncbi:MAG: hypothetical protein PHF25_00795 [Candidatus Margulisbacteria bacterium]|nr:hypothetical protein [Candidatus Margulisiibacteriota bacterium]
MSFDVIASARNIENPLIVADGCLKDGAADALAERVLGNSALPEQKAAFSTLLNGLAKTNTSLFAQVEDVFGKDNSKGDEFYTPEGVKEFRAALKQEGTPITAEKLAKALDSVRKDEKAETFFSTGTVDTSAEDVLDVSGDKWDAHIKSMVKINDAAYAAISRVDANLDVETYKKLSESWGTGGIPMNLDGAEFKKRVALLVLAKGTTFVNGLCKDARSESDDLTKQASGVLDGIDKALDTLMETINDPTNFLGVTRTKKVKEEWGEFVGYLSTLPNADYGIWAENNNIDSIKNIASTFILAFAEEATKQEEGTQIGAWAINTIFANGERYMTGIHGDKSDFDVFSKVFKEGFLLFASSNNITGKVVFRDENQLDSYQDIFKTKGQADEFFKNHLGVRKLWAAKYPEYKDDSLKLLNLFISDLQKANVIEIDDTHREWTKFGEESKLGAMINEAANKIEAKYGKEDKQIPKDMTIAEIFTEEFSRGLSKDKDRIYDTYWFDLKEKVKIEEVADRLMGMVPEREAKIKTAVEVLHDDKITDEVTVIGRLMDICYGPETSKSSRFLRTGADTSVDVATKLSAGIQYLASDQFKTDGGNTPPEKGLTDVQYDALRKAMLGKTATPAADSAEETDTGASRAPGTGAIPAEVMERLRAEQAAQRQQ